MSKLFNYENYPIASGQAFILCPKLLYKRLYRQSENYLVSYYFLYRDYSRFVLFGLIHVPQTPCRSVGTPRHFAPRSLHTVDLKTTLC